jgi:hypothetical protein
VNDEDKEAELERVAAVSAERDAYLRQRDEAVGERNELRRQLDIALGEREELRRQLDIASAQPAFIRDELIEVAVKEREQAKYEAAELRVRCRNLMADLERLRCGQE